MPIPTGQASLGYMGWVRFGSADQFVRATSCDIKASQAIEPEDVVDGKLDKTVYRLGPIEIGGSVAFPAVYELYGQSGQAPAAYLWDLVMKRLSTGEMNPPGDNIPVFVKYVNDLAFNYTGCVIDTYEFNITQQEPLNISVGVVGKDRMEVDENAVDTTLPNYSQRNTRVITWNDVTVDISKPNLIEVLSSEIRSFTATVANNVTRYYSLNSSLTPALILPTQRDITGTIGIIGRNLSLGGSTYTQGANTIDNRARCKADASIRFGYSTLGQSTECGFSWHVNLEEMCIFQIEEIAITNDLFETTVNWRAMPGVKFGSGGFDETFVE